MLGDFEAVLPRDPVLQRLDPVVLELHNGAAAGADEVVVVVAAGRGLVARLSVSKLRAWASPQSPSSFIVRYTVATDTFGSWVRTLFQTSSTERCPPMPKKVTV